MMEIGSDVIPAFTCINQRMSVLHCPTRIINRTWDKDQMSTGLIFWSLSTLDVKTFLGSKRHYTLSGLRQSSRVSSISFPEPTCLLVRGNLWDLVGISNLWERDWSKLVEIFSDLIIELICKDARESNWYGIIIDETSVISRYEQVSFCFSYTANGCKKEEFVGFHATETTDGETLYKLVKEVINKLQLGRML